MLHTELCNAGLSTMMRISQTMWAEVDDEVGCAPKRRSEFQVASTRHLKIHRAAEVGPLVRAKTVVQSFYHLLLVQGIHEYFPVHFEAKALAALGVFIHTNLAAMKFASPQSAASSPYVLNSPPGPRTPQQRFPLPPALEPMAQVLTMQGNATPGRRRSLGTSIVDYQARGMCGRKRHSALSSVWGLQECRLHWLSYEAAPSLATLLFGEAGWREQMQRRETPSKPKPPPGLTFTEGVEEEQEEGDQEGMASAVAGAAATDQRASQSALEPHTDAIIPPSSGQGKGDDQPSGPEKSVSASAPEALSPALADAETLTMSDWAPSPAKGPDDLGEVLQDLSSTSRRHEPSGLPEVLRSIETLSPEVINTAHRIMVGPLVASALRITAFLWSIGLIG